MEVGFGLDLVKKWKGMVGFVAVDEWKNCVAY